MNGHDIATAIAIGAILGLAAYGLSALITLAVMQAPTICERALP